MSSASSPPHSSSVGQYTDPNKPLPHQRHLRFRRLTAVFKRKQKLPRSPVPLTERNLTEFFNPDYDDEHDAFHPVQRPRKVSVSEWIQLLP